MTSLPALASKKIKTAIASFGMSGKLFHAPFIQAHPGFELTGIVERNKNESRERYPDSKLYRSFEEMLSDDSLDLVVINTPVQTHYEYAKAAIMAGRSIVVEKPFTVTAKEAEELDNLSKEKNVFLSVYQNRRYDGEYRKIKQVIADDLLGELKEVEIRYDRYRITFSGKAHKEGELEGAGILHDLGAHLIDQSLQFFGWPEKIFADIRILRDGGVKANDYFELLLFYPGLRVRLKSTVVARESPYAYILQGMKGSFLQERSDRQEEQLLAGVVPSIAPWCPPTIAPDGLLHTEINGEIVRKTSTSTPGNYMDYYDDVHKAFTAGAPNPVPASDAVKTMKIIDAALRSAAEEKIINL